MAYALNPRSPRNQRGAARGERGRVAFAAVFLAITVLYYFLRFQFDLVKLVPVVQFLLLGCLAGLGLWDVANQRFRFGNIIDVAVFLLVVHFLVFSVFVLLRDGPTGLAYAAKDYFAPLLLYFYFRDHLGSWGAAKLIAILEAVFLIVAVLYIAEFVHNFVLHKGYFEYTRLMNDYAMEKGVEGGLSQSAIEGDLYDLIRMPGPLSANNTTGLAIALGLVLATRRLARRVGLLSLISVSVFAVALVLTGARTAMFAGLAGMIVSLYLLKGGWSSVRVFGFVALLAVLGFVVLATAGIIDVRAFGRLFSGKQMEFTLRVMLDTRRAEFVQLAEQLQTVPFVLLTGLGPATPSSAGNLHWYFPALSEDLFLVQVLSMYGVVLPCLLLYGVVDATRKARRRARVWGAEEIELISSAIGAIFAIFVSASHTNAMVKPQIYPILFVMLAIVARHAFAANRPGYYLKLRGRRPGADGQLIAAPPG